MSLVAPASAYRYIDISDLISIQTFCLSQHTELNSLRACQYCTKNVCFGHQRVFLLKNLFIADFPCPKVHFPNLPK